MWRHRLSLIDQWNRANLILTSRLLAFTYGPTFPELKIIPEEDTQLMPKDVTDDCIAQSWYRFLRIIGSPTALCCPQVISNTPQFIQNALLQGNGQDPSTHPCLLNLPQIFLKSIKGIACIVDAFLGELLHYLIFFVNFFLTLWKIILIFCLFFPPYPKKNIFFS